MSFNFQKLGVGVIAASVLAFAAPTRAADIVDTAVSAGKFKTLVTALKAAGLVDTLKGSGPFTVFAPTDAAFAKVPAAKLKALLANKAMLKKVLLYHVIPGDITAKQAMSMKTPKSPPTVEGQSLMVHVVNGKVKINNATVVMADVKADNGVIHAIDTVLMPPAGGKMMMKPKMMKKPMMSKPM